MRLEEGFLLGNFLLQCSELLTCFFHPEPAEGQFLLDEPFAGVDPIAVIDIQRIIRFLKQRGIGVLITDHNVRETLGICDRAYIMNDGALLASGKPDEIVYNDNVRRVYLGEHFRM